MGQLDGQIVNAEVPGLFAAVDTTDAALTQALITLRKACVDSGAQSLPTVDFTLPAGSLQSNYTITAARVVTAASLTASDTNYKTLTVEWNDGAGGSKTVAASATTKTTGAGGTGNWTASSKVNIPVVATSSANVVPSGSALYVKAASTSGGVTLPALAWEIDLVPSK